MPARHQSPPRTRRSTIIPNLVATCTAIGFPTPWLAKQRYSLLSVYDRLDCGGMVAAITADHYHS